MVGIDLSAYSVQTLEFACELAQDLKSELIIVNVINQRDVEAVRKVANVTSSFPSVEEWVKAREEERTETIKQLLGEISFERLPVNIVFRTGVPFQKLIEAVEEEGADLLVIGAKGRTNLAGVLFGQTAEKVFRRSPVPVVSLRAGSHKEILAQRAA
jgi:nucleotide-binding universal stress UspA family protein